MSSPGTAKGRRAAKTIYKHLENIEKKEMTSIGSEYGKRGDKTNGFSRGRFSIQHDNPKGN